MIVAERDVLATLTPHRALDATREAFKLLASGRAETGTRQRQVLANAVTNTMWAAIPGQDVLGVKTYPVVRHDVTRGGGFTMVVYRLATGERRAVLDADWLGRRRTAAGSVLAAQQLSRPGWSALGLIGVGVHARAHVEAFAGAGLVGRLLVAGRDAARAASFADWARREFGMDTAVLAPAEVARRSDVVATVTGAARPVLSGEDLRPGTLLIAVGSNQLDKREIDAAAVLRADRIVVDDRLVAAAESGNLAQVGGRPDDVVDLGSLLLGTAVGRRRDSDVVLYCSHGLAIQDLACAMAVLDQLGIDSARTTGSEVPR